MKVLFFGLGGIGQRHLRNLRKIQPDIQIAAFRNKGRTFEIGNDLLPDYNSDIVSKYNISTFEKFEDAMKCKRHAKTFPDRNRKNNMLRQ